MPATLMYVLTNETTGVDRRYDSLNGALDAVNDNVGNSDIWVVQESTRGRPEVLRWVAEGRGHARTYHDMPTLDRRGARQSLRI
ncbi:MAG: hypothetical protein E6G39_11020 [Actinobacteria bacterium]|nr:MAG: hypothetical protein E6G39_11020 [Actinomycetota bacterium]